MPNPMILVQGPLADGVGWQTRKIGSLEEGIYFCLLFFCSHDLKIDYRKLSWEYLNPTENALSLFVNLP